MKRLAKFSTDLQKCERAEDVFQLLQNYAKTIGFEFSAFGQVANNPASDATTVKHYGMVNYPAAWVEQYEAQGLYRVDPIVQRSHEIDELFIWSEMNDRIQLTREEAAVFAKAADHGLTDGITIPLHGRSGKPGLICFATADERPLAVNAINEAHAMALLAFSKLDKMLMDDTAVARLSKRQVECLYWTAMGKSSKAIADILDLKENTVTYHIKTAMKHLGTKNRTVAVLKCITAGAFHIE